MTLRTHRDAAIVAVILLLAFALRYYVSFLSGLAWHNTDTYMYFNMAAGIREGHPLDPAPNGYPLLIAALQCVSPAWTPLLLISLNVVLSTLVVYLAMDVAAAVAARAEAGYLAGLVLALYPNQINYVRQLMTEVPTAFALMLGLWLMVRQRYGLAGLVIYAATVLRSSLLPVLPVYFLLLLPLGEGKRALRFAVGVTLGGIVYYALLFGGIVHSPSNTGSNLLVSIASDSRNIDFLPTGFSADEQAHPLRTYLHFAQTYFPTFLRQRLYSLQELWGWPAPGNPPRSLAAKLLIALRLPMLGLAIAGWVRHRGDRRAWWLAAPIILVTLLHIAFFSTPRFTYVIEPPLIILASLAFGPWTLAFLTRRAAPTGGEAPLRP